jgi:hypothetical protein
MVAFILSIALGKTLPMWDAVRAKLDTKAR